SSGIPCVAAEAGERARRWWREETHRTAAGNGTDDSAGRHRDRGSLSMTAQRLGRRTRELWPEEAYPVSPGPFIDLWEDDGGFWQWTYTDDGTRLPSNRSYPSREAAEESARIAYPKTPIREASAPPA